VVEDIRFRRHHDLERAVLAQEVRGQDLDGGGWAARADGADGLRKMSGAAIGEVVAVDRGNDDMGEPELEGGFRDAFRLQGV
jgi:hypothetical protein